MPTGTNELQYSGTTKITGSDEAVAADVEFVGGRNRIHTSSELSSVQSTPFNEILAVSRTTLINYKPNFGLSSIRDKVTATGTGAVTEVDGEMKISTGTTTGSSVRLETKERGNYVPGYSFECGIGFRITAVPTLNQSVLVGYFDALNGYMLGVDSNGPYCSSRKNGVNGPKVYQADWNIDKLDGTGKSGATVNWIAGNILHIDATWYGYGQAIFYAYVLTNGVKKMVAFHSLTPPGGGTMIADPNQPIAVEVTNGSTSSNVDVFIGGRQFSILGPYDPELRTPSEIRTNFTITSSTSTPVIAVRLRDTFRGRPNSIRAGIFSFSMLTDVDCLVELWQGSTVSGGAWGAPTGWTTSDSGVDTNTSMTSFSGGFCRKRNLSAANQGSSGAGVSATQNLQGVILHPGEPVVLSVTRLKSVNTTIQAVLTMWEEW